MSTNVSISKAEETKLHGIIQDMENSQIFDERELLWLSMIEVINENIRAAYKLGLSEGGK